MGGGDHHHKVVVPDYRIYKVENVPELVKIRDALAEKGLKDPWLRNEVWRFGETCGMFKTVAERGRFTFLRGWKEGAALTAITVAIEYAYKFIVGDSGGHGGHGGGGEGGTAEGHPATYVEPEVKPPAPAVTGDALLNKILQFAEPKPPVHGERRSATVDEPATKPAYDWTTPEDEVFGAELPQGGFESAWQFIAGLLPDILLPSGDSDETEAEGRGEGGGDTTTTEVLDDLGNVSSAVEDIGDSVEHASYVDSEEDDADLSTVSAATPQPCEEPEIRVVTTSGSHERRVVEDDDETEYEDAGNTEADPEMDYETERQWNDQRRRRDWTVP